MAARGTRRNDHRISFRRRAERVVGSRQTAEIAKYASYGIMAFVAYKAYKWWAANS